MMVKTKYKQKRKHNDANEIFSEYMKEISRYPILSEEEERETARKAKKGDTKAMEKLIKSNLRFVVMYAQKYRNRKIPIMDLINEGNFGLSHAARKYDPDKGVKFTSYAVWWIKWAILKLMYEQKTIVHVPLYKANEFFRVSRIMDKKMGQNNELDKDVVQTKLSEKEYSYIKELYKEEEHLDSPSTDKDTDLLKISYLADDNQRDIVNEMADRDLTNLLKLNLDKLTDIEKNVIVKRYGLFGNKKSTLSTLADKYHCTKEKIRLIEKRGVENLKSVIDEDEFRNYMFN